MDYCSGLGFYEYLVWIESMGMQVCNNRARIGPGIDPFEAYYGRLGRLFLGWSDSLLFFDRREAHIECRPQHCDRLDGSVCRTSPPAGKFGTTRIARYINSGASQIEFVVGQ